MIDWSSYGVDMNDESEYGPYVKVKHKKRQKTSDKDHRQGKKENNTCINSAVGGCISTQTSSNETQVQYREVHLQ